MADIFGNFSKLLGDNKKRKVEETFDSEFSYADTAIDPIGKVESKVKFNSFFLVKAIVIFAFCILVFKLFSIQIFEGSASLRSAEKQRIRPRVLDASRGAITDINGALLAKNVPSFALAVYPSELPKKKSEREEVYKKISAVSGLSVEAIASEVEKNDLSSLDEVDLKVNLSHDEALLMEQDVAGIAGTFVAIKSIRQYTSDFSLSHLLGYTYGVSKDDLKNFRDQYYQSDRIGKIGIEAEYEKYLKGDHGVEQIEVDSRGNIVRVLANDENKQPVPGDEVVLNIDLDLQKRVTEVVQSGIDSAKQLTGNNVTGGVGIVMDIKTGGILAMVSLPSYNNNLFASKISNDDYKKLIDDTSYPMFNRAIAGVYPPGSISKIIMASAGLQEGTISQNTAFDTPAAIKIGDYTFPDNKDHGVTDIKRAIAESNNIFFYSIGGGYDKIQGIGIDKIKKYWELFGLGKPSGIDIPGEASGLLPDAAWKKKVKNEPWYIGDTYHVSIGQGDLLVNPLQMIRATAVIASGGKLLVPQLVNRIVGPDGKVVQAFQTKIERENFINPNILSIIASGMRMTVTDGTCTSLNSLPFAVAGKTGTAQFDNNAQAHAWFEGYAPYNNPEIAVLTMVEGGGSSSAVATPMAGQILDYYFANKK
jgi:penicillin-binding protein 2